MFPMKYVIFCFFLTLVLHIDADSQIITYFPSMDDCVNYFPSIISVSELDTSNSTCISNPACTPHIADNLVTFTCSESTVEEYMSTYFIGYAITKRLDADCDAPIIYAVNILNSTQYTCLDSIPYTNYQESTNTTCFEGYQELCSIRNETYF